MLFHTSTVGISHRTRGLNISAPIKSEVLSDNSMRLRCRLLPPLLRMTEILYLKKRSAARDFALPIRRFFERKRMIFWDNFEFYSITKEDSLQPPLCVLNQIYSNSSKYKNIFYKSSQYHIVFFKFNS